MQLGLSKRRPLSLKHKQWIWAYVFLLVPLIFFLGIRIAPTLYAFRVSLYEWDPIAVSHPFVGLDNYTRMLDDDTFKKAFVNTWVYVLVGVPAGLIASLAIALGLNRITRFLGIYRMFFFVPFITSLVAVSWVWRWLFNTPNGFFNDVVRWFGFGTQGFLGSPSQAIYAIIAVTVWHGLGFQIIIWLAGLQAIPDIYYEAAEIDGANAWQRFRNVTLPLLNPTLVFLAVIGTIGSLQVFTQIRNMSSQGTGGPLDSTISLVLYTYVTAFDSLPSELGYATAIVVVLFFVILAITIFQLKVLQKRYEY